MSQFYLKDEDGNFVEIAKQEDLSSVSSDLSAVQSDISDLESDMANKQDLISASTDLVARKINAGIEFTTEAPTSANTDGIKIAVLPSEPQTKFSGWLYLITES